MRLRFEAQAEFVSRDGQFPANRISYRREFVALRRICKTEAVSFLWGVG